MQVQKWLGHHKASFTIDTYVHLLDEDLPEAVDVAAAWGSNGATTMGQLQHQITPNKSYTL